MTKLIGLKRLVLIMIPAMTIAMVPACTTMLGSDTSAASKMGGSDDSDTDSDSEVRDAASGELLKRSKR